MEALAVRLSGLDPYVGGAIRVVAFYDTLMRHRVDLAALARATAGLAECTAGIRLHGTGRDIRSAPDGTPAAGPAPAPSSTVPITLDEEQLGTVWLERPGPPGQLDDVVLDRLALAVAATVERYGPARTTMADPALVELAVSADTEDTARARALRLLGFPADRPVHVAAVRLPVPAADSGPHRPAGTGTPTDRMSGPSPSADRRPLSLARIGALICPGRPVKAASLADTGVLLATAVDPARFPAGVRAGLGTAGSPDLAWRRARTALRFTTPRQPIIEHSELGALALLAEVPPDTARANPDVAAVTRLAACPDDLDTLDAYCATGSLRRAAEQLHLHHSSIARRIDQIGRTLDLDLTDPTGLTRARLALTTWRLLAT
ncbi:PucR family transcriptional regulator [Kitasatospora sp. NPDC048365]|uniref:PucR family transcriptional regulator n=1 Tax=Kitasatospora sp. NPDC048365 TaxID=3364050 RepID=UPI00371448AD